MTMPHAVDPRVQAAREAMQRDNPKITLRSCWHCNAAHTHLREEREVAILCFACGHLFYRGVRVTEDPEAPEEI
jgi:hypothetical protein